MLAEAVGLKTQPLSGTTDELASPIEKERHNMKKLISMPRSLGKRMLLSRNYSHDKQGTTEETEMKSHENASSSPAEAGHQKVSSAQTPVSKLRSHFSVISVCSSSRPMAAVIVSFLFSQAVFAADFAVTSPGFFYAINGNQPNPTITLVRGRTYTFAVNSSSIHPFEIISPGVLNNNIGQGIITYTVPTAASNYSYICSIHGFGAQIITVAPAPPPPPTIRILSLALSNNVVLRSTGTNGWSVNPEYSTNFTTTNWFALSVLNNSFQKGINETICGRPPGTNVFFRIRSQPN